MAWPKNVLPSKEELDRVFKYDPKTGKLYWRIQVSVRIKVGDEAGCPKLMHVNPYLIVRYGGVYWRVHRIIWVMVTGKDPGDMEVDHINGNTLDNRIKNLRLVSSSHNKCNSKIYSNNTSGVKGVSLDARSGKWAAYINFQGKRKSLGYWKTKEEAAKKVEEARKQYHGIFSNSGV